MNKNKSTPEEWEVWQAALDKEMVQCINDTAQSIISDHVSKARALDIAETSFNRGSLAASRTIGSVGENAIDRRFYVIERTLQDTAALLKGIELQLDTLSKSKGEAQQGLLEMAKNLIDRIYPEKPEPPAGLPIINGPSFPMPTEAEKAKYELDDRRHDIQRIALHIMQFSNEVNGYPNGIPIQNAVEKAIMFKQILADTVK